MIASVERTIRQLTEGSSIMTDRMFDGFDHERYRDEVRERWGAAADDDGDRWWRSLDPAVRDSFQRESAALAAEWAGAAALGLDAHGDEAQSLAARHVRWLGGVPVTLRRDGGPDRDYVLGLVDLYVADERFAANYGGVGGAQLVREALRVRLGVR